MKSHPFRLSAGLFFACCLFSGLFAEEAAEEPAGPAEPPYKVGDLLQEGGYEVALDDGLAMNFRMVDDQIRLYFLDEDKKVIEPLYTSGSVRFADIKSKRNFYPIQALPEDLGLGSEVRVPAPHRSFTILTFDTGNPDAPKQYSFRYLPSMNPAPLEDAGESAAESGDSNSMY